MAPVMKRPGPQGLVRQALACKNDREVTTKPMYQFGKASLGSGDSFKIPSIRRTPVPIDPSM